MDTLGEKNYYQTLNVTRNSSKEEINKAYKKLALKYHPDKNPSQDATAQFQAINEAIGVLSDDKKRAAYNQLFDSKFVHYTPIQKDSQINHRWERPNKSWWEKEKTSRMGDEKIFFVLINMLALPKELFSEAREFLAKPRPNPKEDFSPIKIDRQNQINDQDLQNSINRFFLQLPDVISIFSNEKDALKFKQSAGHPNQDVNDNIQCFGIVMIFISSLNLQKMHSAKDVNFNNNAYQMNEAAYVNFNPEKDVRGVNLYAERRPETPLVNINYQGQGKQLAANSSTPRLTYSGTKSMLDNADEPMHLIKKREQNDSPVEENCEVPRFKC